ncbi:MAG: DUF4249 domain-containing protein [Bacteroidales bacterium]|nr:DUF4249 domain-containing protein [Bacteroidales bacterium]
MVRFVKIDCILFLITIIVVIVFISCEKDITLDLKEPEDMLCLDCILEAGNDSIVIYVTKVQSVENADDLEPVDNAEIVLQEEGEILPGIVNIGNGSYLLAHTPEEGKTYEIQVKVDGYKSLSAETKVPLRPVAEARYLTDTIPDEKWEKGYYTVPKIFIELVDRPMKDYYWFLRAYMRNIGGVLYGSYAVAYQTDNLLFDAFNRYYYQDYNYPFTNYDYIGALRLDDEVIKNDKISFSISTWIQPTVFVINADENFDKYYKSSIKQFLTYEYDQLPVFEPVQIYSNIENGFGVFGSIAITQFYFDE